MDLSDEYLKNEGYRADCYRLLSAFYCKPGKEFTEENLPENLAASLEPVCNSAATIARNIKDALSANTETEILVDYSALFIGPFKLLAPPYGSVYLEEGRQVMGDTTIDAVRCYNKAGVEMDMEEQKDIPDHISVELEFMYYLISKGLGAVQNSDKDEAIKYYNMQEDFLKRHIGAWVPLFAADVRDNAKTPFYKNLGECTLLFIKSDLEYFMAAHNIRGKA